MLPHPSVEAVARILYTCTTVKNNAWGLCTHKFIRFHGLSAHSFLGNRLVSMLVEVGCLEAAHEVFKQLISLDQWSWNALIGGFVKSGNFQRALCLYDEMQEDESLHPSGHTFAMLLKACMQLKDWVLGIHLHTEVARTGVLENNVFVGSTLVHMYVKCGFLSKAQQTFDSLPTRDIVLQTALMTGYLEHGLGENAIECFDCVQSDGVVPDSTMVACALKACASTGNLEKGQQIHAEIERCGLYTKDIVVGNTLVDMYVKFDLLYMAEQILYALQGRNVVSWNALITGLAEHGDGVTAVNCFERMQLEGVKPDSVTLIGMIKAYCSIGAIEKAAEIYHQIEGKCLESDLVVASTLVHMYAKCGELSLAREVFDKVSVRDAILWTSLMAGYAENGQGEEALDLLEQMQLEGVSPNAVTYVSGLKSCGSTGSIDKGTEIHMEIERQGLLEKDLVLGNTLIDMYTKCGLLSRAQQVFNSLPVKDVISWNVLLSGYSQLGKGGDVGNVLEKMLTQNIRPDMVTFIIVLSACLRAGLLHKSETYFENMSKEFGILPSIKHRTCLVDHFCRAGQLDKATTIMRNMSSCPNLVMLRTLLRASRNCDDIEFGREAFQHAISLDWKDATAYFYMSQICANAHSPKQET